MQIARVLDTPVVLSCYCCTVSQMNRCHSAAAATATEAQAAKFKLKKRGNNNNNNNDVVDGTCISRV